MAKKKKSKLDPFVPRLVEWFTAGDTLDVVQKRLAKDYSCSVSTGRLSEWWEEYQNQEQKDRLLAQVVSGARVMREVDAAMQKNPPPEMAAIMSLLRVLIAKFSVQANVNPEMVELVHNLLSPVIKWYELQGKTEDRELNRKKFQRDTCELYLKWYQDKAATEIASDPKMPQAQKIETLGQKMFGELW